MVEEQKNEEQKQEEKTEEKNDEKPATAEPQKSEEGAKEPAASQPEADKQAGKEPKPEPKPEPKVGDKVEEKEIEVPAKFKKLVDEIEKMSIMDLAELVKILEKKFGVSPVSAVAVAPLAGGGPAAAGEEEKSEFTIELKDAGKEKIKAIRVVREITGKGLKEAKDLVDSAPKVVKENVKKEEAEEIKKKFEAAGASVELK